MKLGPDSIKKISDLFSSKNRYHIPVYQRRYVWDMANWETLWRDLTQLQSQIDAGQKNKKHFTGTIVTHTEEGNENWDIIDGQQRLTTFQVIFCVIRDLCTSGLYPSSMSSDIKSAVTGFSRLSKLQTGSSDGKKHELLDYRLIPTAHDRKAFQLVVEGKIGKRIKNTVSKNSDPSLMVPAVLEEFQLLAADGQSDQNRIITAYGYFGVQIIDYLRSEGSEKLRNLTDTLSDNFRVIRIDLDDTEDEPEKVFETINDTGRMLDDFDYLRNHLFLRFRKLSQSKLDELYTDHWEKFEKWDAKRQDLFFRKFLMAKLGPRCFESKEKVMKSFDLYRKYSSSLADTVDLNTEYTDAVTESLKRSEGHLSQVEYELEQLSCYADSYQGLTNYVQITKSSDLGTLGNRMQFYDDLNLPRLDSFILFLKHECGLKEIDLHIVCDILESYIVRRMLCCDDEDSCAVINDLFSQAIKEGKFCKQKIR